MFILIALHLLCIIHITYTIFVLVRHFPSIIWGRIFHNNCFLGFYKIDPHDSDYNSKQKRQKSKMFEHISY